MSARPQAIPAVQLRDLTLAVGEGRARRILLRQASIDFRSNAVTCIVGPSGSGKSSLLKAISGSIPIADGDILVAGRSIRRLTARQRLALRRQAVTLIHQSFNLVSTLTARENIRLGLELSGTPGDLDAIAEEWLARLGLEDLLHDFPTTLSGGEQQRVAIGRSLAASHPVVLADEPTGALDTVNGNTVIELLGQFSAQGRCCIVVTHDPSVAEAADVVYTWHDEGLDQA